MESKSGSVFWRQKVIRVYLSGFIGLALVYFGWRLLDQFLPWFEDVDNPLVAGILAILAVIILPPILGSLVQFGLKPILGKWSRWSELVSLEERLVGELSNEKKKPVIVLVNWPSEKERTIGVMTSVFPATDSQPENGCRLRRDGASV